MGDPAIITTKSIVSHRTKRGVVVLEWGDMAGQFDPEDARQFAHTILRECDNAETDSFMYEFLVRTVAVDHHAALTMLVEYRAHRARLEQRAGLRRAETGSEVPPEEAR